MLDLEGDMPSPIPLDHDLVPGAHLHTPPIVSAPATSSTPQIGLKTPNKLGGHFYHSQQFQTPTARLASRVQQASPCLHTPSDVNSHPQLHTPSSLTGARQGGNGQRSTPRFRTPSSGSRSKDLKLQVTPKFLHTPKGAVYNPFEGPVDQLGGPVFSPNVFAHGPDGDENSPGSFRWSIDQIAILKPADIEENPVQQDMCTPGKNPELEERAQRAIDAFFSNQYIVPSPWSEPKRPPFTLPATPGSNATDSPMIYSSKSTEKQKTRGQKDACCQTALTLPLDFDIEKLLGEQFIYEEPADSSTPSEEVSPQDLSSSSLRRKLFFAGDMGTPLSPVSSGKLRAGEAMDYDQSPDVSPVKCFTPSQCQKNKVGTPGSGHFSSSPITGKHTTPSLRRCSTAPAGMFDSPEVSPIGSQGYPAEAPATPLVGPAQGTPSVGRPMPTFGSPGMSPIHSGSYVSTPGSCASGQVLSGSGPSQTGTGSAIPFLLGPVQSPRSMKKKIERQFSPILKDASHHNEKKRMSRDKPDTIHEGDMEVDLRRSLDSRESFHKALESKLEMKRPYSVPRDFEFGDYDESANQDPALQTYFTSSDTGYHSNSLQLTSQDSASQYSSNATGCEGGVVHSNLTTQFSSMPFSSQDTGFDYNADVTDPDIEHVYKSQYFMKNVPKGMDISGCETPTEKTVKNPKFAQLNFNEDCGGVEPVFNQEEVMKRARRALALNTTDCDDGSKGLLSNVPVYPWVDDHNSNNFD